jgi:DNA-binding transcriptional LysR family regulator
MDTRLLRSFVIVAEELHFRRAAERTHLAQPAMSRQIKRLEDELGVQPFIRDRRKEVLTEAGRAFLKEARRAERGETGSLYVGYAQLFIIHSVFPEAVRHYRERFAGVMLEIRELYTTQAVEALLGGDIDVGLGTAPVTAEELREETLLTEPLVVALPDSHRLASNAQVALEDLAEEPFVLFSRWQSPGQHDLITGVCREAGFVPNVVMEANSVQGVVGLVAAGIGVTLVLPPRSESKLQRPGVVYKEIAQRDIRVRAGMAWRSEEETPVLKGFMGEVREAAHAYSGVSL